MKIPRGKTRSAAMLFAILACLTGCRTARNPVKAGSTAISQNGKKTVLLRVIYNDDQPEQDGPTCHLNVNAWQLGGVNEAVEMSPARHSLSVHTFSKSLAEEGWYYLTLEPGAYCVQVMPRADNSLFVASENRPVFYLPVPLDGNIVYAGTVVFDRHVEKPKFRRELFVEDRVTEFKFAGSRNETAAASQAMESLRVGEVKSSLLVPYDKPFPTLMHTAMKATESSGGNPNAAVSGNNRSTAEKAALPLAAPGSFLVGSAQAAGGTQGGIYLVGAGAAFYLLAAPIAVATYGITAEMHHRKWAPYEAALQNEVNAFHLNEQLHQAVAARMENDGTNSLEKPALQFQVQPYRVVLRGDEKQKFAVEIAVRARILNATDGKPIWQHDYVDSGQGVRPDGICETQIPSLNSRHPLEDFHGETGSELLRTQLKSAVAELSAGILDEMQCFPAKTVAAGGQ